MEHTINRYLAGELTPEEKDEFLVEVNKKNELREELIDSQNLVALVDWVSFEEDNEHTQLKLNEFMRTIEKRKNR